MTLSFERRGHVALITINRPEVHNALDTPTVAALADAWAEFDRDPDLRVAIITGAGGRAFSAGADLRTRVPGLLERGYAQDGPSPYPATWKPVIAAIAGYCLAGGLALALACDIRIAATNAVFGTMGVRRGIPPAGGQTQRLPRLIPFGKALELLFTGELIDAREALAVGLVNRVVEPEALLPTAFELAEKVAANAPLAVQAAKEAAYRGIDLPLDEALKLEAELFDRVARTEDALEGTRAFVEKRPPVFRGR